MKQLKQILCTLCCIVSLIPATAFALDETPVDVDTKDAFLAAVADDTISHIRLTDDMDLTNAGVLDISGHTIDLGGKKISASNFTLILEGTDFTLRNGTFDSKGGSYACLSGTREQPATFWWKTLPRTAASTYITQPTLPCGLSMSPEQTIIPSGAMRAVR